MDNISDINDLKRLYQLYIMMDKMLNMQQKSDNGINYETLKKLKLISIRINYLHMQESLKEISNLEYETKDYYEEQEKLSKLVNAMENADEARKILINKYRKYSVLPLVLEDTIGLENLQYYRDKLDNISEYIKNENYLIKLDASLSELGLNIGSKVKEEEDLILLIPLYEKRLKSYVLDNEKVILSLQKYGFDIKKIFNNESDFYDKYEKTISCYNDERDKYEAIKFVDKKDYDDVIYDITNEYNNAKVNYNIAEILRLLVQTNEEYDSFFEKRKSIKVYLMELNEMIFGKGFYDLLNSQLVMCEKINSIKMDISEMRESIHKNNSLLVRIKNNQKELKQKIEKKKDSLDEEKLKNQIVNINNSSISYSKERVNKVLKFVYDKLNASNDSKDVENKTQTNKEENDELFTLEDQYFLKMDDKVESYDDIFENVSDKENLFLDEENKNHDIKFENFDNNIFNNKINPEIVSSNVQFINSNGSFWPNIG